jgi:hypothetical protein
VWPVFALQRQRLHRISPRPGLAGHGQGQIFTCLIDGLFALAGRSPAAAGKRLAAALRWPGWWFAVLLAWWR